MRRHAWTIARAAVAAFAAGSIAAAEWLSPSPEEFERRNGGPLSEQAADALSPDELSRPYRPRSLRDLSAVQFVEWMGGRS